MFNLSNAFEKTRVIIRDATGGVGSALARQWATRGCQLSLVAREQGRRDALADELHVEAFNLAATNSAVVERCVAEVSKRHGRVDGVVNCTGSPLVLSPENSWVTGQVLAVGGGLSSVQP